MAKSKSKNKSKNKKEKGIKIPFDIGFIMITAFLMPFLIVPKWVYEYSTQKHFAFTVLFTILFGYYFIKKKRKSYYEIEYSYSHLFLLGFVISAFLSLISLNSANPYFMRYSIEVALYSLFIFFISLLITNRFSDDFKNVERLLLVLLISATIIAVDGLLNKFLGYDIFFGKYGDPSKRITLRTTIGNPNFVSDYLAQLLPIAFYFSISPTSNLILRVYALVNIFIMYWVILLAQTRSIYLGTLLGLFSLILFVSLHYFKKTNLKEYMRKKEFKMYFLIAILLMAFLFIVFNFPTPFNREGEVKSLKRIQAIAHVSSWHERLLSWKASVEQWKDPNHPLNKIIGGGIGTYPVYAIKYMAKVQKDDPDRFLYAWNNFKRTHNDYLQVLGETGLLGFIFIIALVASLLFYYLSNVFKIQDTAKILLFISFSWSVIVDLVHSFTEFPMHLQPNITSALIIISIAVSPLFVKTKKLTLSKRTMEILLFSIVLLGFITSVLKFNSVLSEAYFKEANMEYLKIDAYLKVAEKQIPEYMKEIDENISLLRNKLKSIPITSREFSKITEQIKELENQKEDLKVKQMEYRGMARQSYFRSIKYFLKSLDANPAFGKSSFYLAQLLAKSPYRFEKVNYENLSKVFDLDFPEYRHMIDYYEGALDLMPFPRREIRDTIRNLYELLGRDIPESSKIELVRIQMLYDEIDQLESTYVSFNEKNAYRLIGKINYIIYKRLLNLERQLKLDEKTKAEIDRLKKKSYEDFKHWYDQAITILPGGWNRFPEWENIYQEYMVISFEYYSLNGYEKALEDVFYVMEKEAWADKYMMKRVRGIPDKSFEFIYVLYNKLKNAGLKKFAEKLREKAVDIYKEVYEYNKLNKDKYRNKKIKERIDKFLNLYEYLVNQGK